MSRIVLAVETSCDETAIAILGAFDQVLAHAVASQAALHAPYGGVVPEVASRNHLALLPRLLRDALSEAELSIDGIDAYAATTGPGLAAALLVGVSAARDWPSGLESHSCR